MMESLQVAVVVFSLLSLGQTAPVTSCENMTQPIHHPERDKVLGRWNFVVFASAVPLILPISIWVDVKAITQDDKIITTQHPKMFDTCQRVDSNITLTNNTLSSELPLAYRASFLPTSCPDCILLDVSHTGRSSFRSLELISRRTAVKDHEMEEFKKLAECLNLGLVKIQDPSTGFCKDTQSDP